MFRREWDRFCATWPVQSELSDCNTESDDVASWIINTAGPNWQVATRYEFLRLEHLIRANLAQPLWRQLARTARWMIDDIVSGALLRVFRTSWRMGVLLIYSQILLLTWIAVALAGGWLAASAISSTGGPAVVTIILAGISTAGCFALLRPLADGIFVNQLNNCWPYLREFARGAPTGFDRPLDILAGRIVAAARAREADEILVVGHSAGAMLALTTIVRALERDPDIGRHGPQISVVTVGSIMPALAMHPAAKALRGTVAKMATERSVLWVDCQSHEDFMNFWAFDPVAGIGVDAGERRCNPQIWQVPVREMIAPEVFAKVRFNYWRMHYQYIMSNDRRASYDYYMFLCGPAPFADWAAQDGSACERFDTDGNYRTPEIKAAE
ncbi:hypothetical protein BH10PSE11_BH10PSE11_18160 [soil metagenome]